MTEKRYGGNDSSDPRPGGGRGDNRRRADGPSGPRAGAAGGRGGRGSDRGRAGERRRDDRGGDRSDNRSRDDRSRGDKPRGDRFRDDKPRGDRFRDDKPRGDRFRDDRAGGERRRDDRPGGARSGNRSRDDRSRDDRGGERSGNRSRDDRFRGDKPRGDRFRDNRAAGDRGRDDRSGGNRAGNRSRDDRSRDSRSRDSNSRGTNFRDSSSRDNRGAGRNRDRDLGPDRARTRASGDRAPRSDRGARSDRGPRADRIAPVDRDTVERHIPPGLEAKGTEPPIPEDTDIRRLDRSVRAELRSLPKDLAEIVAGHLLLAGEIVDEDPELAYAHAEAARRRAARLPIVREGAAETAYAAGKYDIALGEYRALRRMTGAAEYLPVMADCERALGRPQQALRLLREAAGQPIEPASAIEAKIVEAGARDDLGQSAEAARLLRAAIKEADGRRPSAEIRLGVARLHYALADVLLALGHRSDAYSSFARAAELDDDGATDARERVDELDGLNIEFDDSEESDPEESDSEQPDPGQPGPDDGGAAHVDRPL